MQGDNPREPGRRRLANRRGNELISFEHDGIRYMAGLGRFEDSGQLAEIFLSVPNKIGTTIEAIARDQAIAASIALQHGASPDNLRKALTRNTNGTASGVLGALLDMLAGEDCARSCQSGGAP